jgi:adenylate cyclase class IV
MNPNLQFLEIEHKFVIAADLDIRPLLDDLHQRVPEKFIQTDVQDTYFLVQNPPQAVYRHRIDSYLQQLTVKSFGADTEVRLEVNLDLDPAKGNQIEGIRAFLAPLGVLWQGTLRKEVQAFYFADAEVVYYQAQYLDRVVRCVEIEARQPPSIEGAQKILADWAISLGLDPAKRSHDSLLEILVIPTLPETLQEKVRRL